MINTHNLYYFQVTCGYQSRIALTESIMVQQGQKALLENHEYYQRFRKHVEDAIQAYFDSVGKQDSAHLKTFDHEFKQAQDIYHSAHLDDIRAKQNPQILIKH